MTYILLNNSSSFMKIPLGVVSKENEKIIEGHPSFLYLETCTDVFAKIDINLEETNNFLKAMKNISFEYKNITKTLLKDTILDECYVDYLQIDKSKMMKLKMQNEIKTTQKPTESESDKTIIAKKRSKKETK